MKVLVSIILSSVLLASCAKNGVGNNDDADVGQFVSLQGRSFDEVMKYKYEFAALVCELYVQRGAALDVSLGPNDVQGWDLKQQGLLKQSTFTLSGEVSGYRMDAEVVVEQSQIEEKLKIGDFGSTDEEDLSSARYDMEFTPVLQGRVITQEFAGGTGPRREQELYALERIENRFQEKTISGSNGQSDIQTLLTCTLKTVSRSPYRSQYKEF